jgi:hypothetical protein
LIQINFIGVVYENGEIKVENGKLSRESGYFSNNTIQNKVIERGYIKKRLDVKI